MLFRSYFPRIVVPAAQVLSSFVDFAVAWGLFILVATLMGHWHWTLLAMTPLLVLIMGLTGLGPGLALTALSVQYRDVRHVQGFLVQMWMLATPVIYPASRLPEWAQDWLFLNPMAAVINTYRACLTGGPFDWVQLGLSLVTAVLYLIAGAWFFRKRETRFADIL